MQNTSTTLPALITQLTAKARMRALTDAQWAGKAGVRKETLSRLRRRSSCDLATLQALAAAVGARLVIDDMPPEGMAAATSDGHFPATLDRDAETRLLALATAPHPDFDAWATAGPRFFMAGLAVMLASVPGQDRRGLLALAERLHPGASEPAVFERWLQRSPLKPSRLLPRLAMARRDAA